MQTLVMIHNPREMTGWDEEQKTARLKRVAEWHDYARDLHGRGIVSHAWGSHGLTDAIAPQPNHHLLIAVYQTEDLAELNAVREDDPLLEVSHVVSVPLVTAAQQYEFDTRKLDDMTRRVVREGDTINEQAVNERRAVYKSAEPEYVGQYDLPVHENTTTDFDANDEEKAPLRVLLYGANPDQYVTEWDDIDKLLQCERSVWWHDYMAMQHAKGIVTHVWGTNDATSGIAANARTRGSVAIYEAEDFDQFSGFYRMDPLRTKNIFMSIVLRPIADQRRADLKRLDAALGRSR